MNAIAKLGLAALGLIAFCVPPALAQSVRILGEHSAWSAYATAEGAERICFALSRPTQTSPQPSGFTQGYFYITHRPGQAIRSEINIVPGYAFAPGSAARLSVGGQSFALYVEDDAAWLADPNQTAAATQAIRGGSTMTVEGTALGGETVSQTYSLSGATAATNAINDAC
ncbi:invasion associated locus B family protein [Pelagibacterium lacus]|uniref:Invasion associated locus B family protein n=1 Tax=Pelagibacterium lacus TaxID=2282655 RepID=A0A369W509_9HYPH|nr:invasion associated locus B family protein [Pelagibacterium lacus]RDE09648.1 hypothetical protein DVH29_05690 [Pelagibacterium lacus]